MNRLERRWAECAGMIACMAAGCLGSPSAHAAGFLDSILGKSDASAASSAATSSQRLWRIRDFSTISLVPREAGSAENRQPARFTSDEISKVLQSVQYLVGTDPQPLFDPDELAELIRPLVQAFERAGPGDDILLQSASRREGGILAAPTAVTARLFVLGDRLQLIVHDARFDFYDTYRGTNSPPRFTFGSRTASGKVTLRAVGASNTRADWLSIPLRGTVPAQPQANSTSQAPAATSQAPAAIPAAAPTTPAAAVAPPPPAARAPFDAAAASEIERRLETLKRLHDKGLIDEDEYRQKRKEILQLL